MTDEQKEHLDHLMPFVRHKRECPQYRWGEEYPCSCGLHAILVALGKAKVSKKATRTAVFWIQSSRGTRDKVTRELPASITAGEAKAILVDWCATHSAWTSSENHISYAWRWEDEAPSKGEPWPEHSRKPEGGVG